MELTAFNADLGQTQGRLPADGASEYNFVLGSDEPGHLYELVNGDRVEIQQEMDLSDVDFIRAQLQLTVPKSTPEDYLWEASIAVDNLIRAFARCSPGRSRKLNDMAANVSKLSGSHLIGVRLSLVRI